MALFGDQAVLRPQEQQLVRKQSEDDRERQYQNGHQLAAAMIKVREFLPVIDQQELREARKERVAYRAHQIVEACRLPPGEAVITESIQRKDFDQDDLVELSQND